MPSWRPSLQQLPHANAKSMKSWNLHYIDCFIASPQLGHKPHRFAVGTVNAMNTNAERTQASAMSAYATSAMRKATQAIRANARVLRYLASSLSSTAVDYTLLLILNATIGGVFLPVALARVSSCTMNYAMNRKVFNARGGVVATAIRYAIMAASVMTMSYLMIQALVSAGMALWMASLTASSSLFIVNYLGQNFFVFGTLADFRAFITEAAASASVFASRAATACASAIRGILARLRGRELVLAA